MNTLVRGQKLPIFSGAGLPGLELAARDRGRRAHPARRAVRRHLRGDRDHPARSPALPPAVRVAARRWRAASFYLNRAGDPTIERLLAPRLALTQAEYLAFERGMQVLVVLADVTNYCEALRELGAAREEIPGRRGYPGYMYTDLATIFERAGVVAGRGRVGHAAPDPHDAGRRHHPPDSRPHRLHHRGPDRAEPGARPPRRLPADRRAAVAVAPDERRHRRQDRARPPPLGRSALRDLRAGAGGAVHRGHRGGDGAAARRPTGAGLRGAIRAGVRAPGRHAPHHRRDARGRLGPAGIAAARGPHRIPEEVWARRAGRGGPA